MAVSRWIRNSDISFMGQKVIRIAAADKIALAIDLGRKLRIGHPLVTRIAIDDKIVLAIDFER